MSPRKNPASPADRGSRPVAESRPALYRELHDGLLQTLTGTSLELQAILRIWDSDPKEARTRLIGVARAISEEQRELRFLVDESRERVGDGTSGDSPFRERIESMMDRARTIWGVSLEADLDGVADDLPASGVVLRMLQEAVANAARHGAAESISLRVRQDRSGIGIDVSDDGTGFPFSGRLTHEELMAKRLGPVSLKRRVADEGGRIQIESSDSGATVRIWIPCPGRTP